MMLHVSATALVPIHRLPADPFKMEADEQACPDCAETIKKAAKVCRFWGLRLNGAENTAEAAAQAAIAASKAE